ncbi:MAG: hypothetical protein ABEH86_06005 [Haloarcula sp.]
MDISGADDPNESGGVLSEKSEYEPSEFDPESLGPDVPSPTDGQYQGDATGLFVKLVIVFNVALLALSLGPMLAYFEGQVDLGIRIFLIGVIAFSYGTLRYIRFERQRKSDDEGDNDTDEAHAEDGGAGTQSSDGAQTTGSESGDHNG